MSPRVARSLLLSLAAAAACGGGGAAGGEIAGDGTGATGTAVAEGDPEGDEEEVEPLPIDGENGHIDGPLGTRRSLVFGLMRSTETQHLRNGQSLNAYRFNRDRKHKVGDVQFTSARWWFSSDDRLRRHQLWAEGMSSADCALAATALTELYGAPARSDTDEMVWVGDKVLATWSDRTRQPPLPRCELEWIDLEFYRQ